MYSVFFCLLASASAFSFGGELIITRSPSLTSEASLHCPLTHQSARMTTMWAEMPRTSGIDRRSFVGTSAALLPSLLAMGPNSASARSMQGQFTPETAKAGTDKDALASGKVKQAISDVRTLTDGLKSIKGELLKEGNSQADVEQVIKRNFKINVVRERLETVNAVFDEETQIGTDRTIRLILQDINELLTSSKMNEKTGQRSDLRLSNLITKLDKLEEKFDTYLSYVE